MHGLIQFIARNLVDDPDGVQVRVIRSDRYATVLGLHVSSEDLGKVIGKQGRVAKAMRTLMRTSASLQGKQHIGLEIDDREPRQPY
ncbi:MAG: KH domain-containing protein [Ktedonobacterales bacterium]|nr:KH domain-containing protein [Ktedonobacterales bacterium]